MSSPARRDAGVLPLFATCRRSAQELGVTEKEIKSLIASGVLQTKAIGKQLRITRKSLRRAVETYG
jgi:hypothetical protein